MLYITYLEGTGAGSKIVVSVEYPRGFEGVFFARATSLVAGLLLSVVLIFRIGETM